MTTTYDFDVLVVGAGLSGIGAGYHLQTGCPNLTYAILESRPNLGGTWDLFRYPGIRSDSDMFTLGYSFYPWKERKSIADGPSILKYIKETAREFGIDRHILFSHKVVSASWQDSHWTLGIEVDGKLMTKTCRFLLMCSGYYDYDEGYTPEYPGREKFLGEFVHPQKWTEKIQYAGKRVVVIGSGATAVTLVPELAKTAAHVTMLQRSPSYIASVPSVDLISEVLQKYLPERLAHSLILWKNILLSLGFYKFCRRFPNLTKRLLLSKVRSDLAAHPEQLVNFTPKYNPWDQRLCAAPDGDFFKSLASGKATVVTDTIETLTASGLRLASGQDLPADLIITATGLNLKLFAGVKLNVNGETVNIADRVPYKGAMLSGVPNVAMALGYTNISWTLKCDLICAWVASLLQFMSDNGYSTVTPDRNPQVSLVPMIDFTSGYFERAKRLLPQQGRHAPWKLHQNYFADLIEFKVRPLNDRGLHFSNSASAFEPRRS